MQAFPNVGRQVGLLARLWRTEMDNRLRPLGLSQARWVLLVHLSEVQELEGLAQLDLADRAGVTGPTLVRQLDLLEAAKFVVRREDASDRRIKRVTITKDGRAKLRDVDVIATALRGEVLAGTDPEEIESAMVLMAKLSQRFENISSTVAKGAA